MTFDVTAVLTFSGGCIVAGLCALYWKRRRFLHLVPFLYSFATDIAFRRTEGLPLEWQAPLFFGVMFYVIGWLAAYSQMKHAG